MMIKIVMMMMMMIEKVLEIHLVLLQEDFQMMMVKG